MLSALPEYITINEAREFKKQVLAAPSSVLASCVRSYENEVIADCVGEDQAWSAAWATLNRMKRRLVVALCAISDNIDTHSSKTLDAISKGLQPLAKPFKLPLIAWSSVRGIGLLEEWTPDELDEVETWLWYDEDFSTTDYHDWFAVDAASREFAESVELVAFWEQPAWDQGKPPKIVRPGSPQRKRPIAKASCPAASQNESESYLRTFLPIQQLLDIARFRLKKKRRQNLSFSRQLNWLKEKLATKGITWDDFLWKVERYSTNPDAQYQVDLVVNSIAVH